MFIGAAPMSRSPLWSHWLLNLSSSPATRGLLGALLVQWTPWRSVVAEALWWPSRAVIVLALVVVGMRLGSLSRDAVLLSPKRLGLVPALVVKLCLYPGLLLLMGFVLRLPPQEANTVHGQNDAPPHRGGLPAPPDPPG